MPMKRPTKKRFSATQPLRWSAVLTIGILGVTVLLTNSGISAAIGAEKVEAARVEVITIAGMTYSPARLKVHIGDTVQFQNKDIVPHTATCPDGFDSGMIKPGETWSVALTKVGEFHFACQFHTDMKGVIEVIK